MLKSPSLDVKNVAKRQLLPTWLLSCTLEPRVKAYVTWVELLLGKLLVSEQRSRSTDAMVEKKARRKMKNDTRNRKSGNVQALYWDSLLGACIYLWQRVISHNATTRINEKRPLLRAWRRVEQRRTARRCLTLLAFLIVRDNGPHVRNLNGASADYWIYSF